MPKKDAYLKPQLNSATGILRFCAIISVVGALTALLLFGLSLVGSANSKGPVFSGVLTVLVFFYATLSVRTYKTAASNSAPNMRPLVILTSFNLIILGVPVAFFGFLAMFFGVGTVSEGAVPGLLLIFLGCCAVLFYISHAMTLVAASKIRRFKVATPVVSD
jgi:cation transport ATPase